MAKELSASEGELDFRISARRHGEQSRCRLVDDGSARAHHAATGAASGRTRAGGHTCGCIRKIAANFVFIFPQRTASAIASEISAVAIAVQFVPSSDAWNEPLYFAHSEVIEIAHFAAFDAR